MGDALGKVGGVGAFFASSGAKFGHFCLWVDEIAYPNFVDSTCLFSQTNRFLYVAVCCPSRVFHLQATKRET